MQNQHTLHAASVRWQCQMVGWSFQVLAIMLGRRRPAPHILSEQQKHRAVSLRSGIVSRSFFRDRSRNSAIACAHFTAFGIARGSRHTSSLGTNLSQRGRRKEATNELMMAVQLPAEATWSFSCSKEMVVQLRD